MPVETGYYDTLEVKPDATDNELKKSYRKLAVRYHPDRNPAPDANAKFQEIGEAYQILSDPDLRANYDKYGKKQLGQPDGGMQDPGEMFSSMFGGEAFMDLIGEISLIKDFMQQAEVMMSEEDKAAMEAEMAGASAPMGETAATAGEPVSAPGVPLTESSSTPASTAAPSATSPGAEKAAPAAPTTSATAAAAAAASAPAGQTAEANSPASQSLQHHLSSSSGVPTASGNTTPTSSDAASKKADAAAKGKKPAMTPEQKAKLEEMDAAKEKARLERIETLQKKLIDRIRPFVTAKKPGDKHDEETQRFEANVRTQAEDLKLESFGVELLHTIGACYIQKATTFLKSKRFFGGGFFSRVKEKTTIVKEGWGVLGSAMSVQAAMEEMERQQQQGTLGEDELEALAKDVTSKILLVTWRSTKFEVIQVLSDVLDGVLRKEDGVTDEMLALRAKAIILIGTIFKATVPDETDEERRELERLVAQAALPAKKRREAERKEREAREKSGLGPFGFAAAAGGASTSTPAENEAHAHEEEKREKARLFGHHHKKDKKEEAKL